MVSGKRSNDSLRHTYQSGEARRYIDGDSTEDERMVWVIKRV